MNKQLFINPNNHINYVENHAMKKGTDSTICSPSILSNNQLCE
jgi:hypothetical protein